MKSKRYVAITVLARVPLAITKSKSAYFLTEFRERLKGATTLLHCSKCSRRCDSKSHPTKTASILCFGDLGNLNLFLLLRQQKTLRFGIYDFESRQLCDVFPRSFVDFSEEPVAKFVIVHLRFENTAIGDCNSLGR